MKPETATVFACMWLLLKAHYFLYVTRHWCDNFNTLEELVSSIPASSSRACSKRDRLEFLSFFFLAGIQIGKEKSSMLLELRSHVVGMFYLIFLSFTFPLNIPSSSATIPQLFTLYFYFLLFLFAKQSLLASKMAVRNTSSACVLEACGPAHLITIGYWPSALISHWVRGAVYLLTVLDSFRAQRVMVGVNERLKVYRDFFKLSDLHYAITILYKSRKFLTKAIVS